MDFSNGQNNMSKADQAIQPHKSSIWMRPFASRGYSAPSVPTSFQFNGAAKRNDQHFHGQQQFNGGQVPKQHFLNQQFTGQHFTSQQFAEQEFRQEPDDDRHFPSQHFLDSNAYPEVIQCNQNATLAIHSQEYRDRNETKPRLARTEVELLERHFQENHKPPSSLKRQLAEGMNVQVARINNWFQNRRAKAKHERKQETKRLEGEAGDADAEHPEDFDFAQEFPEIFDDEEEQTLEEPTRESRSTSFGDLKLTDAARIPSRQEVQRSGTEIDRSNFDFSFDHVGQFDHTSVSSSTPPGHGPFLVSLTAGVTGFQPQLFENNHASMAEYDEDEFVAQLLGGQGLAFPMPSASAPEPSFASFSSRLIGTDQAHENFPLMSNSANTVASTVEPVQEGTMMRFKSPPPATDIASRRSKRRPAPIGTDAIKDRSTSGVRTPLTAVPQRRVTKSPGTTIRRVSSAGALKAQGGYRVTKSSAHPSQSPLRQNFDFANLSGMNGQVNVVHPNNGGLAPPTPRSPNGQFYMEDHGKQSSAALEYHAEQIAIMNGNFWNHELYQFSPPETPGHHSNGGSSWGYDVSDNALHTPNFGGFPTDPFSLQMHQQNTTPSYVSSSGCFAPGSLNSQGGVNSQSNGGANSFDLFTDSLPMPPYLSPQTSNSSVSPLSSSDNLGFHNTAYEQCAAEGKNQTQFRWDQQVSDFVPPAMSSPGQLRNKTLVFHHATPKDFEGKPCSGQP